MVINIQKTIYPKLLTSSFNFNKDKVTNKIISVFCLLTPKESGFVIIVVTIITRPFIRVNVDGNNNGAQEVSL